MMQFVRCNMAQQQRSTKSLGKASRRRALAVLFLSFCLLLVSQVAYAATRSLTIGTTTFTWDLTPEQISKVDPLLTESEVKHQQITGEIMQVRKQMDKLGLQPLPERKITYELQSQIDKLLEDLRLDQWKLALQVRTMLTPLQRKELGCLPPQEFLRGIELTPAQTESYYRLMRPGLVTALSCSKKLATLNMDQTILLQEMDLVHDCHSSKLDMPALLANQKEMNELNSLMAMERLRVAISMHDLLDLDQKKKLFQGGLVFKIPDPIGASLKSNIQANVPTPEQAYPNITPSKRQIAQYQSIMQNEIAKSEAGKKLRDDLLVQRRNLLSRPELPLNTLEALQEKINKLDNEMALERIRGIGQVRDVLTAEQRHEVFNRHHPKIWKDTGIDEEQDKKIMAIHMEIEEADRAGKRQMANLAADMRRMYYETAANDEEILADQRKFDKAQAEMVRIELGALVEAREALTTAQRLKLVQLLEKDNQALH